MDEVRRLTTPHDALSGCPDAPDRGAPDVGSAVEVLMADRESETDIPAWLQKAHHELIETLVDDRYRRSQ